MKIKKDIREHSFSRQKPSVFPFAWQSNKATVSLLVLFIR